MSGPPLKLLALDGGGVRGLSELIILRELLHRTGYEQGSDGNDVRPCEYFDMIGGTGTGGWIAIMLGRLEMTIGEAIAAYSEIIRRVFSNGKKWSKEGMYKATVLEAAFKDVLRSRLGASDIGMRDESTESLSCRTFVCAQLADNFSGGKPTLFRTYRFRTVTFNPLIWEAARATSANTLLFKRISITDGLTTEVYTDGGIGCANNPIRALLAEARAVFPCRSVGCVISLGAGHPHTISIPASRPLSRSIRHKLKVAKTAQAIAQDCEAEAEKMAIQCKGRSGVYFRFSVDQGMQGIDQADVEKLNAVNAHTSQYLKMETVTQALDEAINAVTNPLLRLTIDELGRESNAWLTVPTSRPSEVQRHIRAPSPISSSVSSLSIPASIISDISDSNDIQSPSARPSSSLGSLDAPLPAIVNSGTARDAVNQEQVPEIAVDEYRTPPQASANRHQPARDGMSPDDLFVKEVKFLAPTVASLREAEKYRVVQQLSELALRDDMSVVGSRLVHAIPIYPMLIAAGYSHAALCLADESVLKRLIDNLDLFKNDTKRDVDWLLKHLSLKSMLEAVTKAKPDRHDGSCTCLLNRFKDRQMIAKCDAICLSVQVALVMKDQTQGEAFLTQQADAAQNLLDLLQALLRHSELDHDMRRIFRYALTKLATKSGRYPQCLHLRNLIWDGVPVSKGQFGDLFKGSVIGRPDRPVAGKVLRAYGLVPKDRFLKSISREVAVWSQLRHPNIVPLYGVFLKENVPCLVSPFVENGNLRRYLKRNSGVNRKLLALDIARGLEYLHGEQPTVIHADIKGDNVLITKTGHACLVDFGLSTSKDANLAQVQSTMPGFLAAAWTAPEVLEHLLHNTRGHGKHTSMSDMYSFGCVCYEIFCDRIPFEGEHNCVSLIIQGKHPKRVDMPYLDNVQLWDFMMRCWIRTASERPSASDAVLFFYDSVCGVEDTRETHEWDYSVLSEILVETEHSFSLHGDIAVSK